jgi:hypothetical protein
LWDNPADISATTQFGFLGETKAAYISESLENVSVTHLVVMACLAILVGAKTTPQSTFLRRNNTYCELRISNERHLEREGWHFVVERFE